MQQEKKLKLYKSLLQKKRLMGLDDLFFFNKFIVEDNQKERQKLLVPHVHGEWSTWHKNSDARIKLLLVPRGNLKSTFITIGYSLQKLAKNRNETILLANATLANSRRFLNEIKDHIYKNETYKMLYGEMYDKSLKWNEDEIVVKGRTTATREASVTAIGVGGNLVSQHYSLILADDLVNNENSMTRFQADKVIDWWKKSLSLLNFDGEMWIIGTRWNYYELYSYLIEKFPEKIDTYIRSAYNPDGSPYFPELLNEEKLKELRAFHGSWIFSGFYLNNPIDEESAVFKKSQIRFYGEKEEHKLPKHLAIFTCCDPAVSQEAHADYSVLATVGIDLLGNWYVLEVRRDKMTVGEFIDALFEAYKKWQPKTMSVETIGQAQALMTPVHNMEEDLKIYLPLVEIKARNEITKRKRIRSALQPMFERGKIFIKRDMDDLIDEIIRFPKAKHEDILDAISDIQDIGYPADKEDEQDIKEDTMLNRHLKAMFSNDHIDDTMGSRW